MVQIQQNSHTVRRKCYDSSLVWQTFSAGSFTVCDRIGQLRSKSATRIRNEYHASDIRQWTDVITV